VANRFMVDTVFINRIITDEIENPFMQKWKMVDLYFLRTGTKLLKW